MHLDFCGCQVSRYQLTWAIIQFDLCNTSLHIKIKYNANKMCAVPLFSRSRAGWVIIINGDGGYGLLVGLWLKPVDLIQRLVGTWHCAAFITWTEWTLAMAVP